MAKKSKCIVDKMNEGMSRTDAESMCETAPPQMEKRRSEFRRRDRRGKRKGKRRAPFAI